MQVYTQLLVSSTFSPSHFEKLPLSCADLHLLLQILVATRRSRLVIRCRITPAVTPAPPSLGSQLLSHTFFYSHILRIYWWRWMLLRVACITSGLYLLLVAMLAQDKLLSFVQGYVRTFVVKQLYHNQPFFGKVPIQVLPANFTKFIHKLSYSSTYILIIQHIVAGPSRHTFTSSHVLAFRVYETQML